MNRTGPAKHPGGMGEPAHPGSRTLVVFDGNCGFCSRAVRWALARDRHHRLRFVAFGSPRIEEMIARQWLKHAAENGSPSSLMVVRDAEGSAERVLLGSDAVVALLRELERPWPALGAALGLIPRPLRDFGYRFVAARRYRIAGGPASCPLPTAGERARLP